MWEGGVGKWFGVQTSSKIFSFIHLWQLQCFGVNIYCHLQLTMAFLPYILQDPVASHGTSVCQVWAAVWMRDGRHSDWSKTKTHKFIIIVVTSSNLDSLTFISKNMCSETKIRDWCRIMPSGASLRNAYRARKGDGDREVGDQMKVPQSFTFMAREGWVWSPLSAKYLIRFPD
jgi:hypothetical protein